MEEENNKMKKKIKFMERVILALHIVMLVFVWIKFFKTKNGECLLTSIWVLMATNWFVDYVNEKKWSNTRVEWRNAFIKRLLKEIQEKDEEIRKLKRGE